MHKHTYQPVFSHFNMFVIFSDKNLFHLQYNNEYSMSAHCTPTLQYQYKNSHTNTITHAHTHCTCMHMQHACMHIQQCGHIIDTPHHTNIDHLCVHNGMIVRYKEDLLKVPDCTVLQDTISQCHSSVGACYLATGIQVRMRYVVLIST